MSKNLVLKRNKIRDISPVSLGAIHAMFIIYALMCIVPLLLVISVSFTDERAITLYGYKLIPKVFSTYAYEFVLKQGGAVLRAYGISLFVTIVGTIISVAIIAMYAYPLSRKDFRHRNVFSFIVFFTMIFNGGLVPWYVIYVNMLHLNNNILIYIIPPLVSAWYILIMRTFYVTNIPDSIIESARIDGAGEFRTFIQIVIPLSKPGLATIALFQTLGFWNEWFIPLMFIEKDTLFSLQYMLYKVLQAIQYISTSATVAQYVDQSKLPSETARMALCVLAIGPIVVAYPFFQKYFIKGLTVGAVKG